MNLLYSVPPEILTVCKFGPKAIDEMGLEELDEKVVFSAMVLAKLGFKWEEPKLDKEWVGLVYSRFNKVRNNTKRKKY